jgi:CAAX protease family protein
VWCQGFAAPWFSAWHLVPWSAGQGRALWWVIGQSLASVLMRVIMGWIYALGGRSLLAAVVFHGTVNTAYSLYPNGGSHYNPIVLSAALLMALGVGAIWRLSQNKVSKPGSRNQVLRQR